MINPYQLEVPKAGRSPMCRARRALEPILSQHMAGFGEALEGRVAKDPAARMRAHTLLLTAGAAYNQASHVARELMSKANPLVAMSSAAFEAALGSSTLLANVTNFTTQMIHWSLDVYPRLLAPNFVSIQPFTQPSGFIFFMRRIAKDAPNAGRLLSTLSTFDKTYGDLTAEGQQIKAVGLRLEKELVEVQYKGLMHQYSHQVDVALRSQYGLDLESLGDLFTAEELAWEVDREIMDHLLVFALTNPAGTIYFDDTKGGAYAALSPSEQKAYDQTFISRTLTSMEIDMSANIYARPNWYVAGTEIAKLLARTPNAFATDLGNNMFDQQPFKGSILATGVMKTGERVYLDPQMDSKTMIAGYTDNMNPFYAGYIMSPFGLASILTASFLDPDNLLHKKSRALAFAKKGVRAEQYRVIKLGTGS